MNKNDQSQIALQIDQYRILGQHYCAGQGRVFKVEKDSEIFIAKIYKQQQKINQCFQRELRCLQKVDSKFSPRLYRSIPQTSIISAKGSEKGVCLIIEYLQGGDLHWYIMHQCFPEKIAKQICKKLLTIMDYLNSVKILHRDIKPANILFTSQFELKITDYGLAEIQDNFKSQKAGTPNFMAPQVLRFKRTSIASDIFSLGVTLFVTIMGFYPFESAKYTDSIYRFIIQKKFNDFWRAIQKKHKVQNLPSKQFRTLFETMISYDQKKRENTDLIRQFQWLQQDCSTQEEFRSFVQLHRNKYLQQQKQPNCSEFQMQDTTDGFFNLELRELNFN